MQFMLLTGKYYPDEDITFNGYFYHFEQFDSNANNTYYENSDGYWKRYEYKIKNLIHYEDSKGYWYKKDSNRRKIIDSGNYNDK